MWYQLKPFYLKRIISLNFPPFHNKTLNAVACAKRSHYSSSWSLLAPSGSFAPSPHHFWSPPRATPDRSSAPQLSVPSLPQYAAGWRGCSPRGTPHSSPPPPIVIWSRTEPNKWYNRASRRRRRIWHRDETNVAASRLFVEYYWWRRPKRCYGGGRRVICNKSRQ